MIAGKLSVCGAGFTTKLCVTEAAIPYVVSPACDATIEHTPPPTMVTVPPVTVHTPVEPEVKLTLNPELAEAVSENVATPNVTLPIGPKVIVCMSPTPVGSVAIALADPPPLTEA